MICLSSDVEETKLFAINNLRKIVETDKKMCASNELIKNID